MEIDPLWRTEVSKGTLIILDEVQEEFARHNLLSLSEEQSLVACAVFEGRLRAIFEVYEDEKKDFQRKFREGLA